MSLLLWEYLRAKTREAVLAGVADALASLEEHDRWQPRAESVRQLTERLRHSENFCSPSGAMRPTGDPVGAQTATQNAAASGGVLAPPTGDSQPPIAALTGMSQRSPFGNDPPRKRKRTTKRGRRRDHTPRTSDP